MLLSFFLLVCLATKVWANGLPAGRRREGEFDVRAPSSGPDCSALPDSQRFCVFVEYSHQVGEHRFLRGKMGSHDGVREVGQGCFPVGRDQPKFDVVGLTESRLVCARCSDKLGGERNRLGLIMTKQKCAKTKNKPSMTIAIARAWE